MAVDKSDSGDGRLDARTDAGNPPAAAPEEDRRAR